MLGTIIGIGAAAGKAIANNNAKNEQIEQYFAKLKEIYPELKPTTIYFPIDVLS